MTNDKTMTDKNDSLVVESRPVCALRNSGFAHPRRGRVDALSLDVFAQEFVALVGVVGSGKSLVLRGVLQSIIPKHIIRKH